MKTALLLLLGGFLCGLHGAEDQETPDLLSMITKLQTRLQDLETKDQSLQNEVLALKIQMQTLERNQFELQNGPRVAFYAGLSTGGGWLSFSDTIKYNNVWTNVGGAYNAATGKFTAPLKGLYVFTFFVHTTDTTSVKLMKNTGAVAYTYKTTTDMRDSSTGVAVVTLEAGDTVNVQLEQQISYSSFLGFYNTFSGFLLVPM